MFEYVLPAGLQKSLSQKKPKKDQGYMTETRLVYLPKSKIILDLENISYIRVYPPKEIKMEFPELVTKTKRDLETKWKCVIYTSNNEIHISGEEARAFIELISPTIRGLKLEEDKKSDK